MMYRIYRLFLLSLFICCFSFDASAAVTWEVAKGRSSVKFKVKHFLMLNVEGKFKKYSGKVTTPSITDFAGASVEASIPVSSIYTGNKDRDAHLRQEDFFFAEKFPNMEFKSTSVRKVGKDRYEMRGMITIRGIRRPITFDVDYTGRKSFSNGTVCCHFKAVAKLSRSQFGLKWNELTETGGVAVGDEVKIEMNVALIKA